LIVVAAGAAIFLIAKVVWVAGSKRKHRRHVQADNVLETAKQENCE
jgi:hypothetical protein